MSVVARLKTWATLDKLIYIWAVVVIGSNLQALIHPHLDWALTFLLVGLASRRLLRHPLQVPWVIVPGAALIVVSICMTALISAKPIYDLGQAAKLVMILIAGLVFFISHPKMAQAAFQTQVFLVFANVVLVVLGIVMGKQLPRDLAHVAAADGRWRTLFNVPGTLGGVGLGVLVYGLYLLFRTRRRIRGALIVSGALALIYFDNSRTMTLLTFVAVGLFLGLWVWERVGYSPRMMASLVVGIVAGIVGLSIMSSVLDLPIPSRFERMVRLVREEGFIAGLAQSDPARAQMMQAAIEAVSRFPVLGSGMGTLGVEGRTGWIEVHMAYLQMWADAGLLAFVGFVWIAVGWIVWVPKALRKLRQNPGSEESARTYNAIFVLGALALSNLLHTYSTEWAQWVPYLMSASFLYNTASSSDEEVRNEFQCGDRDLQSPPAS